MTESVRLILLSPFDAEHPPWLKSASDSELDEYILNSAGNPARHKMGIAERERRHFKTTSKPHWTITPGFIVAFLAMIFAAIAALPVLRDWFQSSPPSNKDASSQPPLSNSTPATPTALQTPPQAILQAQKTNDYPSVSTNVPDSK